VPAAPGRPGSASSARRRRAALGAGALAGAAPAAGFFWPWAGGGGAARSPAAAPPPRPAAPPPPAGAGAGTTGPAQEALPETVQRYLDATVYPPTSGRLAAGDVDLLHPNQRYEQPRPIFDTIGGDPEDVVRTLLTADRYHLEAGTTAHATLEAWRGDTPIPGEIRVREATLLAQGCAGEEGAHEPVAFTRRGDRLEADLPFRAFHDHHGSVLLRVRFTTDGDDEPRRDELRFFHTPAQRIPAELLPGRFRDVVREGSLLLEFGVDVRDPGFYRFDANVFGASGRPVAFAAWKGELGTGVQSIPMQVYGKVLRDAGVPGPYRVKDLRGYRFLDGRCPDRENLPGLSETFVTAAHPLRVFTDEPHMSAHKQRMIEMMLADEQRGIGPELPALPPAGGGSGAPAPPARSPSGGP